MSVINTVYPDLYETQFPESIDNFDRFIDPSLDMFADIQRYYTYINAGQISQALVVLENNPDLKRAIINAENMNKLRDAIIAMERYYLSDIQSYLQNIVVYRGNYSSTAQYAKYNVVNYSGLSYMCINLNTPIGTVPTNLDYWVVITLKGDKGDSGTGLAPRGIYSASVTYNTDDMVTYENALWVCAADSVTGQTPSDSSVYWWKLLAINSTILHYDNSESGLVADNMQDAIDELASHIATVDEEVLVL